MLSLINTNLQLISKIKQIYSILTCSFFFFPFFSLSLQNREHHRQYCQSLLPIVINFSHFTIKNMNDPKPYRHFIEYSKFITEEKYAARKNKFKKKQQSQSLIAIIEEFQKKDVERIDEMGERELRDNQHILNSLKQASLRSEEREEYLRKNVKQFRKGRVERRRVLRTEGNVVQEQPNNRTRISIEQSKALKNKQWRIHNMRYHARSIFQKIDSYQHPKHPHPNLSSIY